MEEVRDCNATMGPVISDQRRLQDVFAVSPHVEGPNHIALPRAQQKIAFTLEHVLSVHECKMLIELTELAGFGPAGVGGERQVVSPEIRASGRILYDDPVLAEIFWGRVRDHVPVVRSGRPVLGLNERLRFLRYSEGQHFAPHYDGSFERHGTNNRSYLTLQLYLSEAGTTGGGTTRFIGGTTYEGVRHADVDCSPERGRALIFAHDILHEGALVTSGVKYTIRTDVEYAGVSLPALLRASLGFGGSPVQNRRWAAQLALILAIALPVFCSLFHILWV